MIDQVDAFFPLVFRVRDVQRRGGRGCSPGRGTRFLNLLFIFALIDVPVVVPLLRAATWRMHGVVVLSPGRVHTVRGGFGFGLLVCQEDYPCDQDKDGET